MTSDGTSKDDVKVPEGDLGKQIQGDFDEGKDLLVTIISAMGEEAVSYSSIPVALLGTIPTIVASFMYGTDCMWYPGHFLQGSSQGCLNSVLPPYVLAALYSPFTQKSNQPSILIASSLSYQYQ